MTSRIMTSTRIGHGARRGTLNRLGGAARILLVASVSVLALGCGGDAQASAPLTGARESEEALVEAVLEALAREDREALQGFLVSRAEYEELLWPQLPDREHTTFDFVWGLNEINSSKGLEQMLEEYGGMQLEFVGLTFPAEPEVHDDFTLHFDVQVKVRRSDTGQEGVLPSFDVFVDYGGVWKLLNYDEL